MSTLFLCRTNRALLLMSILVAATPSCGGPLKSRATGGGAAAAPDVPKGGFVKVTELADYQGQPTFKVETGAGDKTDVTYYYHRGGAGFASIIDRDGNDWIGWKPTGGADGEYRGIPNLGVGRCCHPGYGGEFQMTSTLVQRQAALAVIKSVGAGGFELTWSFRPTHATLTVVKAPQTYWFLYEGTPGGAVDDQDEIVLLSDGRRIPVANGTHDADIPDPEWVTFADGKLDRSLFFAHHERDALTDSYFRLGSGNAGMTVWGIGRGPGSHPYIMLMSGTNHLTIGLIDSKDPGTVRAAVTKAVATE